MISISSKSSLSFFPTHWLTLSGWIEYFLMAACAESPTSPFVQPLQEPQIQREREKEREKERAKERGVRSPLTSLNCWKIKQSSSSISVFSIWVPGSNALGLSLPPAPVPSFLSLSLSLSLSFHSHSLATNQ